MRWPLCFFLICLAGGIYLNRLSHNHEIYRTICDLTESRFYKHDARLLLWLKKCRSRASRVSSRLSKQQLLDEIQSTMDEMSSSHFQVYNPVEDRSLWKGESVDTGIRARYVEDHLLVYKVMDKSPAARAGVKVGDDILAIPDSEQLTPWGAQRRSGSFSLRRKQRTLAIHLEARSFVADAQPRLTALTRNTAWLEVPSFRADFFTAELWQNVVRQLTSYSHVIVDVRENAGGNFVAMLRALSTFHCGVKTVGRLQQPRKSAPKTQALRDDTSDEQQIAEIQQFGNLVLNTFTAYGCYRGKVTILTGSDTSSVAEIFANSFFARPNARVWGLPTAGDVLLAVWYDLPLLGPGFSISIPEAVYVTAQGQELEGRGVQPQRNLYYDLKRSLEGKDSWLEDALAE